MSEAFAPATGTARTTRRNGARTGVIRVVVVDDMRMFAEPLAMAIDAQDDLECVGLAGSVEELVEELDRIAPPDVVLMDVELPGSDGLEGTQMVKDRSPSVKVLMVTGMATADMIGRAAAAGVDGFLSKDVGLHETLSAIRSVVHSPGMLLDRGSLERMLERRGRSPQGGAEAPPVHFTGREGEILRLMGEGCDPKTIARELSLSVHTVRGHVRTILQKLDAHSQLEAVVHATRRGLLPLAD